MDAGIRSFGKRLLFNWGVIGVGQQRFWALLVLQWSLLAQFDCAFLDQRHLFLGVGIRLSLVGGTVEDENFWLLDLSKGLSILLRIEDWDHVDGSLWWALLILFNFLYSHLLLTSTHVKSSFTGCCFLNAWERLSNVWSGIELGRLRIFQPLLFRLLFSCLF